MKRVIVCAVPVREPSRGDGAVVENMPEIRRLRYESVKNQEFRSQLIAAQSALDGALSAHFPNYAPPAQFVYLPDGRPAVRGASVSIAHTARIAVCAAASTPVGVDVEAEDRVIKPSMEEYILYPGEAAPGGLIGAWVDKEAYLKLTGEGISRGMSHFLIRGNEVFAPGGMKMANIVRLKIAGHLVSLCSYDDIFVELVHK